MRENRGLALQGYGDEITDDWSVLGANAPRQTSGGTQQWHIPNQYKPGQAADNFTRVTWRNLPGNRRWIEAERNNLLVYEQRPGDRYARWHYDGPRIDEV